MLSTNNLLNGIFGKLSIGMCRLALDGNIAVRTSNGYKIYNVKTGIFEKCENFIFNIEEEFFFIIPSTQVYVGDIILVEKKPKYVVAVDRNQITVINYEDSTVENIIPEQKEFLGKTYHYSKIVSMFGDILAKDKNSGNRIMQYMMMSEMMKGIVDNSSRIGLCWVLSSIMPNDNFTDIFNTTDEKHTVSGRG